MAWWEEGDPLQDTALLKCLAVVLMIPQDSEVREQDAKTIGNYPN